MAGRTLHYHSRKNSLRRRELLVETFAPAERVRLEIEDIATLRAVLCTLPWGFVLLALPGRSRSFLLIGARRLTVSNLGLFCQPLSFA